MDKKKLIFNGISIVAALVLLVFVLKLAVKILNKEENDQSDTEANLITDNQDISMVNDEQDESDNEASFEPVFEYNSDIHSDVSIDMVNDDIWPDNEGGNVEPNNKDIDYDIPVPEPVVDTEDPQEEGSEGIDLDVRNIERSRNETDDITYGIDVAKWQGVIDWSKVKDSGVEFAMVRLGYRTLVSGEITEDPYAKYNLQQAGRQGIKLGVYFFSTAVSEKEAKEEAEWVAEFIAPYNITYPVVYNCEGFTDSNNRQYKLTKADRTNLAIVFLDYVKSKGYTPMFYASKNEMENNREWDADLLTKKYKIWVAQYPDTIAPSSKSSYSGTHEMWQYTNNGKVPGIIGSVDFNIAYFGYKGIVEAKDDTPVEEVGADPLALIRFKEVNETVTAKELTNLRDVPGTDTGSKVIEVLHYGDTATRTGIGDNGWSRVEYKGRTLYGVTDFLQQI